MRDTTPPWGSNAILYIKEQPATSPNNHLLRMVIGDSLEGNIFPNKSIIPFCI